MTDQEKCDARQRILDAAAYLFAHKGYDGTGVREIAARADVNIAMISYYFNGKVGIIVEILKSMHSHYAETVAGAMDLSLGFDENVKRIVRSLVQFVRENQNQVMAAFNEAPLDIPEVAEIKKERVMNLLGMIQPLLAMRPDLGSNPLNLMIVGPTLISLILIHFRFKPVQKEVFGLTFDDAFYEQYVESVCAMFLHGVYGFKESISS